MTRLLLPSVLLLLLVGCPTVDDDDTAALDDDDTVGQDDDDATEDDDDATPADDDDATPTDDDDASVDDPSCDDGAEQLAVEIVEEPGRLPLCGDLHPWLCIDGYDPFLDHPEAQLHADPVEDCGALEQELLAEVEVEVELEELPEGVGLGEEILDRSGLGWLFEDEAFVARPLRVAVTGSEQRTSATGAHYRQLELLLEDEFIGEVQALLLLPPGPGPFPTVLALPGHIEGPEEHRDRRFGQFFPEHGVALLIVALRAYEQPWDHELSLQFRCHGYHLMTFRAYEAMVALKYLLASPLACNSRLGLIGHSGGSITGNLLIRFAGAPIQAFVSDAASGYFNIEEAGLPELPLAMDCEHLVSLAAISSDINDLDDAPMPAKLVPYAYAEDFKVPDEPDPHDLSALDWFMPFFTELLVE